MITEIGQFFFKFGLVMIILSVFSTSLLIGLGYKVPNVLSSASAFAAIMSGDVMRGALQLMAISGSVGIGFVGLLALMKVALPGGLTYSQIIQPSIIAMYYGITVLVLEGCKSAVFIFTDIFIGLMGPPAAVLLTIKTSLLSFISFSVLYYMLVRAVGAPAE